MTELVGREGDLRRVEALLHAGGPDRVLTVTGPSGVGKSRLVAEFAARARAAGDRPVTTISLRAPGDSAAVQPDGSWQHPGAVLAEAALRDPAGGPHGDDVPAGLLVVDDIDLPAAARLWLSQVLDRSPGWRALVASPTPLGVPGERVHRLAGLPVPEAVTLFVTAAEHLGSRLPDRDAVAALCAELDGLPLALLGAAELVPAAPPEHLLHRLAQARLLDVLGGVRAGGGPSLRAAVERTWRGLCAADQALLARLSVLPATFPLSAALAASGRIQEGDVLAGCARLTSLGVLTRSGWGDGEPRFRLGRAVGELAGEHLPDPAVAIAAATGYYRRVAAAARLRWEAGDEAGALAVLEREWAGLRAAANRLATDGDPGAALELAVSAAVVPLARWYDPEAAGWLDRLRAAAERAGSGTAAVRAEAAVWAARLAVEHAPDAPQPDGPLLARLLDSVAAARRIGTPRLLALAAGVAAEVLVDAGAPEPALPLVAEALALDTAGAVRGRLEAWAAALAAATGSLPAAAGLLAAAREHAAGGERCHAVLVAASLTAALPGTARLLADARASRDRHLEIRLLGRLARQEFERGEVEEAARRAGEALQWLELLGGARIGAAVAGPLTVLVDCAAAGGDPEAAARLHEATVARAPRAVAAALGPDGAGYRSRLARLRVALGEDRYRHAALEAAPWSLADAVRAGQALVAQRWQDAADPLAELTLPAPAGDDALGLLTAREQEVLQYLIGGVTNKAIATALGLSPKTVMHYAGSIYRKLGAQSRAEAAALAVSHGLLPVDRPPHRWGTDPSHG